MSKIWTWEEAEKELFSIDRADERKFRKDIDKLHTAHPKHRRMPHMTFKLPSIYQSLSKEFNLSMSEYGLLKKDTLHKILGEKEGKQDAAHNLNKEQVKGLLGYLADPLMVVHVESEKGHTVASLLDIKNQDKHNYLSFIHTFSSDFQDREVNNLASVYAKEKFVYWMTKYEEGTYKNIVYYNDKNKEVSRILPYGPLRSVGGGSRSGHPRAEAIHPSLMHKNILTRSAYVNQYLENCQLNEYAAALLAKISPPENALNAYDKATKSIVHRLNKIEKEHPNASARGNFTRLLSQTANNAKNEKEWGGYEPCAHVLREMLKLPHITPEVLQKIAATPANIREAFAGSFIPNEYTLQANILGLNHSQSKDNGKGGRA